LAFPLLRDSCLELWQGQGGGRCGDFCDAACSCGQGWGLGYKKWHSHTVTEGLVSLPVLCTEICRCSQNSRQSYSFGADPCTACKRMEASAVYSFTITFETSGNPTSTLTLRAPLLQALCCFCSVWVVSTSRLESSLLTTRGSSDS